MSPVVARSNELVAAPTAPCVGELPERGRRGRFQFRRANVPPLLELAGPDRLTQNPNTLAGRATIRGLRISVAHIVNLVANGMTLAQIVAELPDLEEEDVHHALAYAAALVRGDSGSTA
jgi:uncharacterized protein (DUF433 family)